MGFKRRLMGDPSPTCRLAKRRDPGMGRGLIGALKRDEKKKGRNLGGPCSKEKKICAS